MTATKAPYTPAPRAVHITVRALLDLQERAASHDVPSAVAGVLEAFKSEYARLLNFQTDLLGDLDTHYGLQMTPGQLSAFMDDHPDMSRSFLHANEVSEPDLVWALEMLSVRFVGESWDARHTFPDFMGHFTVGARAAGYVFVPGESLDLSHLQPLPPPGENQGPSLGFEVHPGQEVCIPVTVLEPLQDWALRHAPHATVMAVLSDYQRGLRGLLELENQLIRELSDFYGITLTPWQMAAFMTRHPAFSAALTDMDQVDTAERETALLLLAGELTGEHWPHPPSTAFFARLAAAARTAGYTVEDRPARQDATQPMI